MNKIYALLSLTILAMTFQASAHAVLITTAPAGSTVVDFSQFLSGTGGTVQIGGLVNEDIIWQANNPFSTITNFDYGLGDNGRWDSGRSGYSGLNSSNTDYFMDYIFNDGPVSAVGGFMNYSPNTGFAFIEVLGDVGQILESIDITALAPISTPNQFNDGAFRGIERTTTDIYSFRVRGAFSVLDDLSFSRASIPEPPITILLITGLIGLIGLARRKV